MTDDKTNDPFQCVCVVFMVALFGCQSDDPMMPSDVEKQDETIVWQAVEGAESYVVEIDGEMFTVDEPSFSVLNHPNGDYTIEIRTKIGTMLSEPAAHDFTIDRPYEIPSDLRVEDDVLHWDAVDHATGYEVSVGDDVIAVSGTSYALDGLTSHVLFGIRVRTVYENGTSNESLPVWHHTYPADDVTHTLSYTKGNYGDPVITLGEGNTADYLWHDGVYHDGSGHFTQEDGDVMLTSSWLNTLDVGEHELRLLTGEGVQTVDLTVGIDDKPYIISDNVRDYAGADLVFQFELYEGSIVSVSQTDLTEDDYEIDGDLLTIESSYIERLIDADSDRSTVIIAYQLENADQVVLGYLYIHLQD